MSSYQGPEKVEHLLLVAGISKVGKSTFIEHLRSGRIPVKAEARSAMTLFQSPEIETLACRNLLKRGKASSSYDRLIAKFDIASILRDSKVSPEEVTKSYRVTNVLRYYLHSQRTELLDRAETIDVVTLVAPLKEINQRCRKAHERKAVVRLHTCWLAYLCGYAEKIRKHWVVEIAAGGAPAEHRYHFQPAWEYDFHQILKR